VLCLLTRKLHQAFAESQNFWAANTEGRLLNLACAASGAWLNGVHTNEQLQLFAEQMLGINACMLGWMESNTYIELS
jgi:hypothetical protein